jgi:hypothetical protein
VVGLGMTGLCAALDVLDSRQVDPAELLLVDRSAPGAHGRIRTVYNTEGLPRELGAARYSASRHTRLHGLLERFRVVTEAFTLTRRFADHVDARLAARLADVCSGVTASNDVSLMQALSSWLTPEEVSSLCEWSGYGVLAAHQFPAGAALEVLRAHPESFCVRETEDWRRPVAGFAALAGEIERHLQTSGAHVTRPAQVTGIEVRAGHHVLRCQQAVGEVQLVARRVVLAVPPTDLLSLRHPWPDLTTWARRQSPVPLFKCFYDSDPQSWGPTGVADSVVAGAYPLQKLYFDRDRRSVNWYSDSDCGLLLEDASHRDGGLTRIARGALDQLGIGTGIRLESEPVHGFWPAGITYPRIGSPAIDSMAFALSEGAALASDGLTPFVGWLEGCIASARTAVEHLL